MVTELDVGDIIYFKQPSSDCGSTVEGRFVLVHQYRFGTASVCSEIPGGVIDPGEEPFAAAQRELREETGFTGGSWSALG